MTTTSQEKPQMARRWATKQLDLPSETPVGEARGRLLKQLAQMDFMPPSGWDSALRASGLAASAVDVDQPAFVPARRGAEELLRTEVEAFAARFFSLPPSARVAHFQELAARSSGMPAVAARLEAVRPALELPSELPADQPPEVQDLLEQLRRLALLPRQARAARRLAVLKECRRQPGQCLEAARLIQKRFARYAALDSTLVRELTLGDDREKLRERVARQRRKELRKARPPKVVAQTSSGNPWWIGIAAVVIINVLRLTLTSTNQNYKHQSVPRSQPWSVQESQRQRELNKSFTEWQAEFRQREAERKAKQGEVRDDVRRQLGLPPLDNQPFSQPPVPRLPSPQEMEKLHERMREFDKPAEPEPSASSLPTGAQVYLAKDTEEAQEMLRRFQEYQSQREKNGTSASAPRIEVRTLDMDQARALLRQLRDQQAERGPDASRDGAIRALEKQIDDASPSSSGSP